MYINEIKSIGLQIKREKLRKLKNKVRTLDIMCSVTGFIGILIGIIEVRQTNHLISYFYQRASMKYILMGGMVLVNTQRIIATHCQLVCA